MGHHDAETIRQAADLLLVARPKAAVIEVAITPLTDERQVADWLEQAAKHTAGNPYCCHTGAVGCAYAGPALRHARRILAAAKEA